MTIEEFKNKLSQTPKNIQFTDTMAGRKLGFM